MRKKFYFNITGTLFLVVSLILGLLLVQKAVRYFSDASGTPADLVVDMSGDVGQESDAWRNLAQGGESKGRMLQPVVSQLKILKPEYIRIDHVFDFYDQKALDETIADITATGATPFISLSYMPLDMSRGGDVTDLPLSWDDWETRVQNLVEHVSGKAGLAIPNVYYEVWNEPDLFGNYKLNGDKNYLNLYLHTARGVSKAKNVQDFKLGGPVTTAFYPNWIEGLLNYTSKNGLRLDFLSWHKYTKEIASFGSDINRAKEIMAKFDKSNMEIVISEMGPNSNNDPVYDNDFGAIHQIAVSVALQGKVSKVFAFEIIDGLGDQKYWGRWGLFTNEKFGTPVAKPRANAITFLNSMIGGVKINVLGQGSWVQAIAKKTSPNTTRVLVVNYDPAGIHNESVPIKLTNLSFPKFDFKRIDFMGATSTQEVSTVSATWNTTQYFKPNSAAIFEIVSK